MLIGTYISINKYRLACRHRPSHCTPDDVLLHRTSESLQLGALGFTAHIYCEGQGRSGLEVVDLVVAPDESAAPGIRRRHSHNHSTKS